MDISLHQSSQEQLIALTAEPESQIANSKHSRQQAQPLTWGTLPYPIMEDVHYDYHTLTSSRMAPSPGMERGPGLIGHCGGVALVYYKPFLCLACMSERIAKCEPHRMLTAGIVAQLLMDILHSIPVTCIITTIGSHHQGSGIHWMASECFYGQFSAKEMT